MRIFEKEEKPTVEVCRVSYNGDDIEAQFKEGYQTKVVKGSRSPHEDLLAAFGELTRLVQHKLMLTNATYCPCRIKATSVKFVSTDKYTGYSIKSTLTFPSIGTEFNGSSILFIPYSGYWEQEDEDGNPRHDPDDEPQNLTDDEIEILEQCFTEAYAYFYEGKRKPDDQMDLFDGIEDELKAEAEAEAEAEGEKDADRAVDDFFADAKQALDELDDEGNLEDEE